MQNLTVIYFMIKRIVQDSD